MWNHLSPNLCANTAWCTRGICCKDKEFGLFLMAFGRHSVNKTVVSLSGYIGIIE